MMLINKTINITDKNIILRKLKITDADQMYKWASDKEVAKYVLWNAHENINDTQEYINSCIQKYQKEKYFMWGIELIETSELIGTISVVEIDENNNLCEVGYVIGKKWWGNGYATKTLKYVINYLLDFIGFDEVICKVQSLNSASIRVMKKCGMSYKDLETGFIDKSTKKEDNILIYSVRKKDYIPFNKQLFEFDNPSYNSIIKFYKELMNEYHTKVQQINTNLYDISNKKSLYNNIKKYNKTLLERKTLLFSLIRKNIDFFDILKKIPMTVYLNGSYARNSSRVNSDIDLNFMYPNKYIKKLLPVEDICSFIVGNVFDIDYRDRVHPMGYLQLKNKYKINKSKYFIVLFKNNDMIISECRDNCYDIMYEYYNMPRSYRDICSYLMASDNLSAINEFVYNNEIVYSNTKDSINNMINKKDLKLINNKNFLYYSHLIIEKLIEEIEYQVRILNVDIDKIKDFKKIYKTIPSTLLYKFFSMMKRLYLYKVNSVIDIKIDQCFANDYLNKILGKNFKLLEESYYQYLFDLIHVEKIFTEESISLSSHTDETIDKINEKYILKYGKNINEDIKESLKKYYSLLLCSFERVKNIYEKEFLNNVVTS